MDELEATAKALVAAGKGILAADESSGTIAKRFADVGVESTEESRRAYRELLFTTAGAADHISGVILFDETIRQHAADGTPFPALLASQGVIPGIKVDKGTKPLALAPGETITEGLDGLRDRFAEYRGLGARFAKWRAVISIGDGIPSETCLWTNAHALARYAALAQEAGLVPIVEPEVLMDGGHTIERAKRSRAHPAGGLHRAARPARPARGDAAEAEHGALGLRLRRAGRQRRGGRGDAAVPAALSPPQCREWCSSRAARPTRTRPPTSTRSRVSPPRRTCRGTVVLVRPRPAGAGAEGVGRAGSERRTGQAAYLKRARLNGAARDGRYDAALEAAA